MRCSKKTVVILAALAVILSAGWYAYRRYRLEQRETAIAEIRTLGGQFSYGGPDENRVTELVLTRRRTLFEEDVQQVAALDGLRKLDFSGCRIANGNSLRHLASLSSLRVLNIGGTQVGNTGLEHVSHLDNLHTLHLWRTQISDEGLRHLRRLRKLRVLNLWNTNVTDEGLKHLETLENLERLCLGNSNVGDEIEHLNKDVARDKITSDGVARLKQALPDTRIYYWSTAVAAGEAPDGERAVAQGSVASPSGRPDSASPQGPTKPAAEETAQRQTDADAPDLRQRTFGVDWPQFLGPQGDGKSPETGILTDWPESGPPLVWQRRIGEGYSMCVTSRGRLFLFTRVGDKARLTCLNSETGDVLWMRDTPTDYVDQLGYSGGPRASPAVDGNRVYTRGAEGLLICRSLVDGKELWRVDTAAKFHVVQFFFGVASSPVVEGDLVFVAVGGAEQKSGNADEYNLESLAGNGTGLVAFDKYTGEVVYKTADLLASCATPQFATIDGRRWGFAFLRGALVGFEPESGRVDFTYPWKSDYSAAVSASTPVVVDDEVLISESYGRGSSLLKVAPGGYEVVWHDVRKSRDRSMEAHWNTPIHHEGYLYGSSGRHSGEADLRCIDWKTGEVMWSEGGTSRCSLLFVDDHFVVLSEYGQLELIRTNPETYERVAAVDFSEGRGNSAKTGGGAEPLVKYPAWAAPVLSHGLLYVRGKDRLLCFELIPGTSGDIAAVN